LLPGVLKRVGDVGRVDDDVPAAVLVVFGHAGDVAVGQADLEHGAGVADCTVASLRPVKENRNNTDGGCRKWRIFLSKVPSNFVFRQVKFK
jgi:hypothetical protein